MSVIEISLNNSASKLVKKLCSEADKYSVTVEETDSGATLIDAGINASGGFLAGEMITEICLGGYGSAKVTPFQYGELFSPKVFILARACKKAQLKTKVASESPESRPDRGLRFSAAKIRSRRLATQ